MVDRSRNIMFFLFSTSLMLGVAAYISFRLIITLDSPRLETPLIALVFLFSQSISFMRFLVTMAPAMAFRWMRVGGYISALFMTLFSFVVIRDSVMLVVWVLDALHPSLLFSSFLHFCVQPATSAVLLPGSIVFAAWGMKAALRVPRAREVDISIPTLPPKLEGLRIVQLCDLHIGSTFDRLWLERVVADANALNPDLILITGDLVDGGPSVLHDDLLPLKDLEARLAVLISVGNHEYYSGVMPWVQTWRDMGLTVLLNQHQVFDISGSPLTVAGIADSCAARFPGLVLPDAQAALDGAPQGFAILMAHQPRDARKHAALGYALQLSGHTHGGQYFFLFPVSAFLNHGYRSGLYDVGGMKLYVSPGTGMWGYVPMRVGAPSEITVITLRAG